jgi:hypothetical protein
MNLTRQIARELIAFYLDAGVDCAVAERPTLARYASARRQRLASDPTRRRRVVTQRPFGS